MNPVIGINDHLMVARVVHGSNTTVTLNKSVVMQASQTLTFFTINQGSWKEYNLFVGTSPGADGSTITTANNAITAANIFDSSFLPTRRSVLNVPLGPRGPPGSPSCPKPKGKMSSQSPKAYEFPGPTEYEFPGPKAN